jgi:hypothetical protein
LSELIGYLYTWSSVRKFIEKNNSDPIELIYDDDLAKAWDENLIGHSRRVVWPIYMKVGGSWHKRRPEILMMRNSRSLELNTKTP